MKGLSLAKSEQFEQQNMIVIDYNHKINSQELNQYK